MQILDTVTGMWSSGGVEINRHQDRALGGAGWFIYGFDPDQDGYAIEVEWSSGEHGIRFGTEEEFQEWYATEKWLDEEYTGSDTDGYWTTTKGGAS